MIDRPTTKRSHEETTYFIVSSILMSFLPCYTARWYSCYYLSLQCRRCHQFHFCKQRAITVVEVVQIYLLNKSCLTLSLVIPLPNAFLCANTTHCVSFSPYSHTRCILLISVISCSVLSGWWTKNQAVVLNFFAHDSGLDAARRKFSIIWNEILLNR